MKALKFLQVLFFIFIISINSINAQTTTPPIPTSTATNTAYTAPFNCNYEYSWNAQIVTKAELNAAGMSGPQNITQYCPYLYSNTGADTRTHQTIYLRNTSITSYSNSTYPGTAGFTCVLNDATLSIQAVSSPGGYLPINITPFAWDGNSNIEILLENRAGTFISSANCPNWGYSANYYSVNRMKRGYSTSSFPGTATGPFKHAYLFKFTYVSACTGVTSVAIVPSSTQTICEGQSVNFTATPNNTSPFTYQWKKDDSNAPGTATNSSYSATAAGSYSCYVTNCSGANNATSAAVSVNVNSPPAIDTQPVSPETIAVGTNTSVSVISSDATSYQWQVNNGSWSNITGAGSNPTYANWTTATLNINSVAIGNNGYQYRCILTKNSCTITSDPATLSVAACSAPALTAKANDATGTVNIAPGADVNLAANPVNGAYCNGNGDWVYAWHDGSNYWGGTSFDSPTAVYNSAYQDITDLNVNTDKTYTVYVQCQNNASCTSNSNVSVQVVLTCDPPLIEAKANGTETAVTIANNTMVQLTANPGGGANCSGSWLYAWSDGTGYWNGTDFTGGAGSYNSSYSVVIVPNVTAGKTYTAYVKCSDDDACNKSSSVTVNIGSCSAPTVVAKANDSTGTITIPISDGVTLTANSVGGSYCDAGSPFEYGWTDGTNYWDGSDFTSASATYSQGYTTINPTNLTENKTYTVYVRCFSNAGCSNSSSVTVNVAACTAPTITAKANNTSGTVTVAYNTSTTLTANSVGGTYCPGGGTFEYAWFDGSNYWNGSSFSSGTEVYNSSYNTLSAFNATLSKIYTAYVRCQGNTSCANSSSVTVLIGATLINETWESGTASWTLGGSHTTNVSNWGRCNTAGMAHGGSYYASIKYGASGCDDYAWDVAANVDLTYNTTINLTGYTTASLTFWYKCLPDVDGGDYGQVFFGATNIGGGNQASGTKYYNTSNWTQVTIDLTPYCGTSGTFKFKWVNDAVYSGNPDPPFQLDDIVLTASSPLGTACSSPILYNSGGSQQIAFNNSHINTSTPIFRTSCTANGVYDSWQIEVNTNSTFTGTAFIQTFGSGSYTNGTQYNLTFNSATPSFTPTSGTVYYVRARASGNNGTTWSAWTTTQHSFIYDAALATTEWYQDMQQQFKDNGYAATALEANSSNNLAFAPFTGGSNPFLNPSFETTSGWTAYKTGGSQIVQTLPDGANWSSAGTKSARMYMYGGYCLSSDIGVFSQVVDLTGVQQIIFDDQSYYGVHMGSNVPNGGKLKLIIGGTSSNTSGTVYYSINHCNGGTSSCSQQLLDNTANIDPANQLPNQLVKFVWMDLPSQDLGGSLVHFCIDNVRVNTAAPTTGTYTSAPAYLNSFNGALGWTSLKWNQTLNGGTVSFKIQKYNGSIWVDVAGLTNLTASGDGAKTADISSCSDDQIRIVMTMTNAGTSPVVSYWGLTASACTAPSLTAKANNAATNTTISSGTSVNFTANETGGVNCSDYFEFAWSDGTNYWNGTSFGSVSAVYNTSYNNITFTPSLSATYTVTARCHASPTCYNTSQVIVNIASVPATISAVIGSTANGTQHHLQVNWTAVTGMDGYTLEYSNNGSSWTAITPDITPGTTATYDYNAGDNPNVSYYFRIKSKLNSVYSGYATMVTPVYTACDVPATPTVDVPTGNSLNITLGTESPVANPAITTYSIYCNTTSQYVQADGSLGAGEVFQTKAQWATITVTGLTSSTQYCFYPKAKNNDGDVRYNAGIIYMNTEAFDGITVTTGNYNYIGSSAAIGSTQWAADNVANNACGYGNAWVKQNTYGCTGYAIRANVTNAYTGQGEFINSPQIARPAGNLITVEWDMINNGGCASSGTYINIGSMSGSNLLWGTKQTAPLGVCTHVSQTYDISAFPSNNIYVSVWYDIGCQGNCTNPYTQDFIVDNIKVSSPSPTSCGTTTTSSPDINVKQASTSIPSGGSYDFGSLQQAVSGSPVTFTIENLGNLNLNLTGSPKVAISGTNSADFAIVQTGITTPVAPSGSTTFTITFTPGGIGARTAQISIANDDAIGSEAPYLINLTGTGTAAPLCGTYTVGATGDFANLTAVAAALAARPVTCDVIFELQADYSDVAIASTVNFTGWTNTEGPWTVTIRPASGVTALTAGIPAANTPLISLAGANCKYLIFDGRAGGTGSTIAWTIQNRATASIGPVFNFINDATYNTLQYLDIQGGANSATANMQGNIDFGTTTATTGNDNNTVTYCKIHEYSSSYYPKNAIYAAGTSAKANDNITITYNEIYNFTVYGIYGATGVTGPGNNWDIEYNHFYNTANVVPTANFYVIYLAPVTTSTGHKVSNNFIGGHGRNCADPIWDVTSSSYTTFCLIYSGQCVDMEIKNNTLQNIYRSTTSGGSLSGIEIGGTGAFIIEGNTIGHNTDAAKGLIINTQSYLYGIYNSGAGTLNITNNTIANLQSTYAGASADMYGIYTTSGINTISGNIIHDLSANNTNTSDLTVAGIYNSSVYSSAVQTISGNTIYNLKNIQTGSYAHKISGIYHNGASAVTTNIIEKNNIYNISLSTSNAAAEISGIKAAASYTTTIFTYKNNMIRLGYNSAGAAITTGYSIMGINIPVNTYSNFYHNSIYIGGTGVNSSSPTYAFYTTSTATTARQIQNNIFWNARSNGSGSAKNYAIKVYTTTGLTSNYNILYANGTGNVLGVVNTTDYADFTAWQGIGLDANSKNVDPNFVNATSVTPDLHLQSPTDAEATGTNIASVTDDFDGQLRSSFTPTDIGADADNFVNCLAPLISVKPANAAKCLGENVDFTVTASGTAPLIYQWFKQNKAIDNATQSIYSLSNISKSDINEYYCVITNACGSITSDIATISINNFEIQFHPADVTIKAGKIASFSIAVTGNGISYLWQENKNDGNGWQNLSDGGIYSGVLTNKLIINEPNTTASLDMNNYQYQCVVNSSFCSGAQISDAATLTVNCCGEPGLWAGIIDDKWEVEDNWSTGVLPNLLTDVTIPSYAPNQPAIYSGVVAQCKNINILPRASLSLQAGGTLNAAGNMEIESDNTGTGAFKDEGGTVNITGTVSIETFIKNKGYHYISNPINGADLTQINDDVTLRNLNGNYYNPLSPPTANKMPNFWMIDEAHTYNVNGDQNAWKAPAGLEYVMQDMRGYALIVPNDNTTIDLSGSGNSFNTGIKTYNVTKTAVNTIDGTSPGNGYHLVGNPYPCPLDWDEIEDDLPVGSKISSTIAFFYGTSMYYGAWGYYNPIIEGSGSFPHSRYIPSMQGFYVNSTATELLSFDNTHKTVVPAAMSTGFYKKNTSKKGIYPLLRLKAYADKTPDKTDETVLYFISSSTSEYDPSYDGLKLMNTAIELPNIYTYTELENKLSINAQPSIIPDMQIRLGFQVTKSGKFTINATEISNFDIGTDIFLVDTKTGVTQNLRNNPVYKFAINTGDDDNRFFLSFAIKANGIEEQANEMFYAYSNNKYLYINYNTAKGKTGILEIYNAAGQKITDSWTLSSGTYRYAIDEAKGVYVVRFITDNKVYTARVFIE